MKTRREEIYAFGCLFSTPLFNSCPYQTVNYANLCKYDTRNCRLHLVMLAQQHSIGSSLPLLHSLRIRLIVNALIYLN